MADARFLVDTSIFVRSDLEEVAERLEHLNSAVDCGPAGIVDLELVYSSRQRSVPDAIAGRRSLPEAQVTPIVMDRALEVAGLMAARHLHRGAKVTDLIIAAAAETRGLTVLHYDADFERIASVTGQPTEWIAPKGSLDH